MYRFGTPNFEPESLLLACSKSKVQARNSMHPPNPPQRQLGLGNRQLRRTAIGDETVRCCSSERVVGCRGSLVAVKRGALGVKKPPNARFCMLSSSHRHCPKVATHSDSSSLSRELRVLPTSLHGPSCWWVIFCPWHGRLPSLSIRSLCPRSFNQGEILVDTFPSIMICGLRFGGPLHAGPSSGPGGH